MKYSIFRKSKRNRIMSKANILVLIVSVVFSMTITAQDKGLEVAKKADIADQGFESSTVSLTMVLTNRNGQESTRQLSQKTLEISTDGDKSLITFQSPRDVKGTTTLTFTHRVGADDQWLFLPSINRIKRISSNNKSGPFMGSEFAYEDLSSQEVEKYTYKFIEEKDGLIIIEQDPVDPKSGYTSRLVTYNKEKAFRVEKVEFYDRKNSLLKTLEYKDYKLYLDKYWRADILEMVNHQTNKQTKLTFSNYKFKLNLTDEDFSQNALKRAGN